MKNNNTLKKFSAYNICAFFIAFSLLTTAKAQNSSGNNHPPNCSAGGPYIVSCEGYYTRVFLNGSGSVDPDGDRTVLNWESNCAESVIYNKTTSAPTLYLSLPGLGQSQECTATLTISDGTHTVLCSASITASPCPIDCFGIPFGENQLDECGVCGGDNSSCLAGCSSVNVETIVNPATRSILTLREVYARSLRRYREAVLAKAPPNKERLLNSITRKLKRISFRYPKKFNLDFSLLNTTFVISCPTQLFGCSAVDRLDQIETIKSFASVWEKNTIKFAKRALKLGAAKSETRKRIRRAKRLKEGIFNFLEQLPRFNFNCGG